ncbi:DUF2314 domain-containing protein [Actibacterium sp. 188UL27-1]|uniref:DUF2314 domain-containing protein n=1 Tax=Actibacterium sp. 188UL27-1 TaxID=2786961 RepID=UPI001956DBF2|nr:DUF2314 domain-containing protein [Actibacterium sp. 188UL27-1]MBM7068069.1 DUF2314 domain-containing protein [Actibacterium sp. 188UL27-1]
MAAWHGTAGLAGGFTAMGLIAGIGMGMASTAEAELKGTHVSNNVVERAVNDTAMTQARQAARRTLDTFLTAARTQSGKWQSATVQVALERDGVVERIWVSGFQRVALARYQGRLANEPVGLEGLHHGDQVLFDRSQIEDWAFIQAGRGYGFFGVRALLPIMDTEQARGMRAFLAVDPLPKGW